MQLLETDEHRLIRESVIKLCSEFSDDYWEQKDRETSFPFEFFDTMAQAGWIGIAMPEEYGIRRRQLSWRKWRHRVQL